MRIHLLDSLCAPGGITSFHRAKLLDLFASGISSSQVHFNKQLASYIHTETGVRLLFKDGSEANADALIAADGVNSTVRRLVLDSYIKRATTDADRMAIEQLKRPFWTRTVAYRALLDPERLRKINSLHPSLTTPHHVGPSIIPHRILDGLPSTVVIAPYVLLLFPKQSLNRLIALRYLPHRRGSPNQLCNMQPGAGACGRGDRPDLRPALQSSSYQSRTRGEIQRLGCGCASSP